MGMEDEVDRLYRNKVILAPMVRAVSKATSSSTEGTAATGTQ